jgi:hypothetical protein
VILGTITNIALSITAASVALTHQVISPSFVNSLKAKPFFLSTGRTPNFIAPSLAGKLIKMQRISVSLRSKMLFFTVITTMTIPFTIILIDEVGVFTIKTG